MSYDLAVFDPRIELQDREAFETWYDERTEWEEDLNYNDPANATPALQAWFHEMRQIFVPLNGPFADPRAGEDPDVKWADYTIAPDIIYAAFSWSMTQEAYEQTKRLAEKHRIAFLDASGDEGAAWFPSNSGTLKVVHTAAESEP